MNLPNRLTMFRIFMIPVFMLLLIFRGVTSGYGAPVGIFHGSLVSWLQVVAVIVFAIASATDWLDGHIARSRHMVTNFGKFADPLADKMLTMTAFIFLVSLHPDFAWIVSIIVCRELAVTGLRLIVVENNGEVIAAKMPGKIKTTAEMLAIIFLFLGDPYYIGTILLYIALIFAVYSGYDYFHSSWSVFKGSM